MSGDASEHVERYLRQTFRLDSIGLQRVGLFLLAHVLIDTHLIAHALFNTILTSERRTEDGLRLTDIEEIADEMAQGTFGKHLDRVKAGLPGDTGEIAGAINEARNALLHWRRDRFSLPVYKGQDVTTEPGFRACMEDVLRFIQTVPFDRTIAGDLQA